MKAHVLKINCLTNLHVGSGDINYNIVDNEVEKDPVTGYPIVHASGIKGAFLSHFKDMLSAADCKHIFGAAGDNDVSNPGAYKFFDAHLITRRMRVGGSNTRASIPVATVASINAYLGLLTAFGCNHYGIESVGEPDFGDNAFLAATKQPVSVEGEKTGTVPEELKNTLSKLSDILGKEFALAKTFDGFDLPVVARNKLDNGESKALWYEEMVPHGSVFYMLVLTPDDELKLDFTGFVQIGGHASIGCGFTDITVLK